MRATTATTRKSVPAKWDATRITSQKGKIVIVTGANTGLGYVTALELARHGADVVLACRNKTKGLEAVHKMKEELTVSPEAGKVQFRKLDVSSLASVRAFANDFKAENDRLDLLINNAGIMAVPYALTVDGIESQFATNHLGHFALTVQLFELLKNSKHARVINVSSGLYKTAKMDLKAIAMDKAKYSPGDAYSNSKLYNLLFTFELNRRLLANGIKNVIATTAHPGFVLTDLKTPLLENSNWLLRQVLKLVWMLPISHPLEQGVLPSLYAATARDVTPDDFYGPDGMRNMKGYPALEEPLEIAKSERNASALWQESERLSKLRFTL